MDTASAVAALVEQQRQQRLARLRALTSSMHGGKVERLDEIVRASLAFHPPDRPDDFGVENPEFRKATRDAASMLRKLSSDARSLLMGVEPPAGAKWTGSVNGLALALFRALEPSPTATGDELEAIVERLEDAIRLLAGLEVPSPVGIAGRPAADGELQQIVLAVCIHREECGLPVQYDFDAVAKAGQKGGATTRSTNAQLELTTDTAALVGELADIWGVPRDHAAIRTALRKLGSTVKARGVAPSVNDLITPFPQTESRGSIHGTKQI